jgi:aryl-alcohol dehydrogenase-like predicted oxidoreductase
MKMEKVKLGSQGLQVSKLGFGCMGLTTAYGNKLPDEEIVSLLKKVYEQGVSFWDTASLYVYPDFYRLLTFQSPIVCQDGIIGKAIQEIGRENIVLAHKTGVSLSVFPKLKVTTNGQPSFVREECESALCHLKTDYIDLFYLHRIDQTLPIEITMLELKKLVKEGKVKYLGLSECSAATLRRAHQIHPITAIQMEYSLWERGVEGELVDTCAELGVGLVPYSPLGRGFFGGAHKKELASGDFRNSQERFKEQKALEAYEELEKFAESKQVLPSQLALAWAMAQNERLPTTGVVPIPGTTKEKNLLVDVGASKMSLSKEDINKIESIVSHTEISGARYEGEDNANWETEKNPHLTEEQKAQVEATLKELE